MNRELIVNTTPDGVDIALLEDKELVELHRERSDKQFKVGDVYLGRVSKVVPNLNAAFVDVGFEKDAFLHYTDLGPNIRTLMQLTKQAVAGNLSDPTIKNLKYEKEIVKTGKVNEVLNRRQSLLVQVLKEPISTKGPRLSCDITLPGRYVILMPFNNSVGVSKRISTSDERKRLHRLMESIRPQNFGVVVRTVAEGKSTADLHEDMSDLLERWKKIMEGLKGSNPPQKIHGELNKTSTILRDVMNDSFNNIIVNESGLANELEAYIQKFTDPKKKIVNYYHSNTTLFDNYGITRQIKSLFGRTVTMQGGAYLVIEHTEALHVIDVNSGHKFAKGDDQETSATKVNMVAAKEIARQLRLRDIGGIIVVDFIDMRKAENRKSVYKAVKDAMQNDRAKHSILQLSRFGLMQITRERTRPEINIITQEICPTCEGTGKIEASILVLDEIERDLEEVLKQHKNGKVNLFTHPFIAAYLKKGLKSTRFEWFMKYKKWVGVLPNDDYHLTEYHFFDKEGESLDLR